MEVKRSKKRKLEIAALIIVPAILIILVLLQFFVSTTKLIEDDIYYTQAEDLNSRAFSIVSELTGHTDLLTSFAAVLAKTKEYEDFEKLSLVLDSITKESVYADAYYISTDGTMVNRYGQTALVADREYFIDAMKGNANVKMVEGRLLNEVNFMVAVPIITKEGIFGVLAGGYTANAVKKMLSETATSIESVVMICRSNGEIVAAYSKDTRLSTVFTTEAKVFDVFQSDSTKEQKSIIKMIGDLKNNTAGGEIVDYAGNASYASYVPLGINDCMIISIAPQNAVLEYNKFITINIFILSVELFVVFFLAIVAITLLESKREKVLLEEKESLRISEERYRIVESMSDSVLFEGDYRDNSVHYSENFFKLFRRNPSVPTFSEFMGEHAALEHLVKEDREIVRGEARAINRGKNSGVFEYRMKNINGRPHWYSIKYNVLRNKMGEAIKVVGKIIDIDLEKREQQNLLTQAETDGLTKLINHESFITKVDAYLKNNPANSHSALFMIDVDNFKNINDSYGHLKGDEELVAFATLLKSAFRSSDLVGRLGGDEFAVFIKNVNVEEDVYDKAEEVIAAVRNAAKESLISSISIGIALSSPIRDTFQDLYKCADTALYEAKMLGKDRFVVFEKKL